MNLPNIQSDDVEFQLMQNRWSAILNPLLAKPLSSANILKEISITTGVNTINHLLGRKMQGWIICDITASAILYRSQPMNDKTLTISSNGDCVVNLVVY